MTKGLNIVTSSNQWLFTTTAHQFNSQHSNGDNLIRRQRTTLGFSRRYTMLIFS